MGTGRLIAEVIPFKNDRERIDITKREKRNRRDKIVRGLNYILVMRG